MKSRQKADDEAGDGRFTAEFLLFRDFDGRCKAVGSMLRPIAAFHIDNMPPSCHGGVRASGTLAEDGGSGGSMTDSAVKPARQQERQNVGTAALLMALAALLNAADAVIVRLLAGEIHPFEIAFFRAVFGLLAFAPWIAARPGILRSRLRVPHAVRAALKLLSLVAFFAAFAAAPLADAMAIAFTGPIFLTLGAWLLLGEKLGTSRVLAVLAAFLGALIIIQPAALIRGGGETISFALLFALAGAALTAAVQLMLKRMSRFDRTDTLVAWNLILTVPIALVPAVVVWTTPGPTAFMLLAVQGCLGALNMTLITRALGLADASSIAPMDFLRLPAVAVAAYAMFHEAPTSATWLGALVIGAATLIASGGSITRIARVQR
jgi:drug/metabolite transporter (DMT)-like permease